ncbi:hypothetical protein [Leeuwenhoekiella sp. ZYFB001]|uniref:hypothetical protein n=1 Tax=Leeuwenhoekiella sp. ZYFB001 TaxID=2719912 RepID=UPI0014309B09|nr:hypothetical protein [Leeuwenhoekiella sp. ZYFB001]
MKKNLFISTILIFLIQFVAAQKIIENKVDEFTGDKIIKTNSNTLISKGSSWLQNKSTVNYGFVKINGTIQLNIKMVLNGGKVFSINDDNKIIFLYENGNKSEYYPIESVVAGQGDAASGLWGSGLWGVDAYFYSESGFSDLLKNKISKVRIYTDEGYLEDDIKSKLDREIKETLELIIKTVNSDK